MCGIIGFTGKEAALPILLRGLERLEYRGYDSAGVTLVNSTTFDTHKQKGRLSELKASLDLSQFLQSTGIGHTRWATHGVPSQLNSHPHTNESNTISIVHNGIIENYQELKQELIELGYHFHSDTDSEVIVHLLDHYYQDDMVAALSKAVKRLLGSFALCVVTTDTPNTVYVAKQDSPMVVSHGELGSFCASDIPAILEYTKDVCFLEDGQMAKLEKQGLTVYDFSGNVLEVELTHIPYDVSAAQKGGYDSFMNKEIHEQPEAIASTLRGHHDGLLTKELEKVDFSRIRQIYLVACGTAWHATLHAQALLRQWIEQPVFCVVGSEFRYGNYRMDEHTLAIFVSQSGETADTIAALKLAQEKKAQTIAISNVLDSSLARLAQTTLYTVAGPEISVASTKAFTTQLVLLTQLCLTLADQLASLPADTKDLLADLEKMPKVLEDVLSYEPVMKEYAQLLYNQNDAYFIGRGLDYVSVLEGALKLKEVSYVHADAYYAGELKHGPIALIEDQTVVIALATQPEVAAKTISNIEETMARGAQVILITDQHQAATKFDKVIRIPEVHPSLAGLPVAILLQLFAYYTAVTKGRDVDKPRNLAKSVTVE